MKEQSAATSTDYDGMAACSSATNPEPKPSSNPPAPSPRYDEVYQEGVAWLDADRGEPNQPQERKCEDCNWYTYECTAPGKFWESIDHERDDGRAFGQTPGNCGPTGKLFEPREAEPKAQAEAPASEAPTLESLWQDCAGIIDGMLDYLAAQERKVEALFAWAKRNDEISMQHIEDTETTKHEVAELGRERRAFAADIGAMERVIYRDLRKRIDTLEANLETMAGDAAAGVNPPSMEPVANAAEAVAWRDRPKAFPQQRWTLRLKRPDFWNFKHDVEPLYSAAQLQAEYERGCRDDGVYEEGFAAGVKAAAGECEAFMRQYDGKPAHDGFGDECEGAEQCKERIHALAPRRQSRDRTTTTDV